MAEIKDKIVTVESLSALHEYDKKTFATTTNFLELQSIMGYDSIDNYTIVFDSDGRILLIAPPTKTIFDVTYFLSKTPTAAKIVLGKNVSGDGGWYTTLQNLENLEHIYAYAENYNTIVSLLNGDTSLCHQLDTNYTYLTDLLVAINIPTSIIPIENGGTNASDGATGLKNLFAAGSTILSAYQYGDTLPAAGIKGRIFFKKLSE